MTSRVAVVVPLYKQSMTESEEFSFLRTLQVLSSHDIYVVCPKELDEYLTVLKEEKLLRFHIEYFPQKFFTDIDAYNNLLMTVDFYRRFESYDYILLVQTDVLVFADKLDEWCERNYSYVGAPWFYGLTRPSRNMSFLGVGNGGFSLRKVEHFISVLREPRYRPPIDGKVFLDVAEMVRLIRVLIHCIKFSWAIPPVRLKINEDLFWGVVVPKRCDFFSVPTPEDAVPFAFEAAPEYLFKLNGEKLPFGCHAWERYNLQFWRDTLKATGVELP